MSRKQFAEYLGYDGDAQQLYKVIKRYEEGSRRVPPLLARCAWMACLLKNDFGRGHPVAFPEGIDEDGEDPNAGAAVSAIGGR